MVLLVFKLILFALSTLGSWELLRRHFNRIDISFIPGITVAIQIFLLFFAGLLNVLPETTYAICGMGLAGLVWAIWKDRSIRFLKAYITPAIIFLVVLMAIMLLALRGKMFTHYDDFSHWALIVKRMLLTDRLPNFHDTVITFQEYPVGSALFIYFVSKLTGSIEYIQMLAQLYMMTACIIPLFALSKKRRIFAVILIAVFTNYVLVYNISIQQLLVDTLLPLVSMSSLLYALLYCSKTARKRELFLIAFYLTQILQIKNSGIFFAIIIAIILIILIWKPGLAASAGIADITGGAKKTEGAEKAEGAERAEGAEGAECAARNVKDAGPALLTIRSLIDRLVCIAIPYLTFILWHKHCQYVFDESEITKHAMTSAYYQKVFEAKPSEDISLIRQLLLTHIRDSKDIWLTFGMMVIVLVLVILFYRQGLRCTLYIELLAILMFVTYQIGLYGMYLFSMQGDEATQLVEIVRYERTIIIAMLYLLMIPAIKALAAIGTRGISSRGGKDMRHAANRTSMVIRATIITAVMTIAIFAHMGISKGQILCAATDIEGKSPEERIWFENLKYWGNIPDGSSYTILLPRDDRGYTYFLIKYVFQSNELNIPVIESRQDMDAIDSTYILTYGEVNDIAKEWIREHYPEQADAPVIYVS